MKNSVCTSRETSTFSLNLQATDTSMSSTAETWSSRHQMDSNHKFGTSTKPHWPSDLDWTTDHGTSRALEEPTTCRSGTPAANGSRYSSMMENTSSISRTERHLMFTVAKMRKADKSLSGTDTTEPTRDGRSHILTRLTRKKRRDWTKISDSKLADHSTSCQECTWIESSHTKVATTCTSRISWKTTRTSSGSSMELLRLSSLTIRATCQAPCQSWATDPTREYHVKLPTQDGGNCSDTTVTTSSTRKERS